MAAHLSTHLPIIPIKTVSGNAEAIFNYLEGQSGTFKQGAPLKLSSGYAVVSSSGFSTSAPIVGFAALPGHNLGSNGAGASPIFGSIGFPGGSPTVGSVPNQSSAVNLPHGVPFVDGLIPTYQAVEDTIFEVQVDNSTGSSYTASIADIGEYASLVTDTNSFWYLDRNTLSSSPGTLPVVIVGLNPQDFVAGSTTTQQANGRAWIKVLPAASAVQ